MDNFDLMIIDLFKRYLNWINNNNLIINNYNLSFLLLFIYTVYMIRY